MTKGKLSKLIDIIHSIDDSQPRDYIGASAIGSDCLRQIWYEAKGYKGNSVPPSLRRSWEIGKQLEGTVLDWLGFAGIDVSTFQADLADADLPYFKGHIDSMWIKNDDAHAIIEVKTAKNSSFEQFASQGVKKWNPRYYAQLQAYMGMSGVFSAYILVLNKDNSDLLDEFVTFVPEFYEKLREKAKMVYEAVAAPPRVNGSPIWYQCKMCKFRETCHG